MPMRREDKELSKYSKYKARVDLTKIRQVASVLALLARSLGLCWGDCTCSHPLASACVGFVCVFGRRESRVVTVVTCGSIVCVRAVVVVDTKGRWRHGGLRQLAVCVGCRVCTRTCWDGC